MTTIINQDRWGTAAFLRNNQGMQMVMNDNKPVVQWSFRIDELQSCITTLEEVIGKETMMNNHADLFKIYCSLQAAISKHEEQHSAVIADAPTADDLQAYLSAYAAAAAAKD